MKHKWFSLVVSSALVVALLVTVSVQAVAS